MRLLRKTKDLAFGRVFFVAGNGGRSAIADPTNTWGLAGFFLVVGVEGGADGLLFLFGNFEKGVAVLALDDLAANGHGDRKHLAATQAGAEHLNGHVYYFGELSGRLKGFRLPICDLRLKGSKIRHLRAFRSSTGRSSSLRTGFLANGR